MTLAIASSLLPEISQTLCWEHCVVLKGASQKKVKNFISLFAEFAHSKIANISEENKSMKNNNEIHLKAK